MVRIATLMQKTLGANQSMIIKTTILLKKVKKAETGDKRSADNCWKFYLQARYDIYIYISL